MKNQWIVLAFGGWAMVIIFMLLIFRNLDLEYFFALSLVGFLIIVQLNGPITVKPGWRRRVNLIILIGMAVFILIAVKKVLGFIGII